MNKTKEYFELIKNSSKEKQETLKNKLIDAIEYQIICEDSSDIEWICTILLKHTEHFCPDCGEAHLEKKSVYTYTCPSCKSEFDNYCIENPGEFNIAENLNTELFEEGIYYRLVDFEFEENKGWIGKFSSLSGEIIKRNINELF